MQTLVPVFQSLEPEDCGAALAALEEAKIPYREYYAGRATRFPRRVLRLMVDAQLEQKALDALRDEVTRVAERR